MSLSYRIQSFSITVGSFDITNYVETFSLSLPMYEIGQKLTWTGRFTLGYHRKAIQLAIPESDFDQVLNPTIWRPAQQPVTITINGTQLPILRIDRYAYDYIKGVGEGTFHQIIDAVATDRPQVFQTGIFNPSSKANITHSVQGAVTKLLDKAFAGATVNPARNLLPCIGTIYDELLSREPIGDACRLLGSNWQWMTIDNTETIKTIKPEPFSQTSLFTRTINQLEWEPEIDHINFAAPKVVVTGSFQQPKPIQCLDDPTPPALNPNLDKAGRPKIQKTEEFQPSIEVFPDGGGGLNPTRSEVKWIFYQYPDDLTWDAQLWQFIPADLLFEIQSDLPIENAPVDSPCQTITVKQQPAGRLFPDLGTNVNLLVGELDIQSERRRGVYAPAGVLDPDLGVNTTLKIKRYEKLLTKPIVLGSETHGGQIDPKTGKPQCLEPALVLQKRQPLAEVPLWTVPVRGTANVVSAGWTPIYPQEHIVDVGFCPGQTQAAYLAARIAEREQARRDSYKVSMPIPAEWLAANCPPLPRITLYDGDFLADGLIITFSQQGFASGGSAVFAFTAARLTKTGTSLYSRNNLVQAGFRIQANVKYAQAARLPKIQPGFRIGATVTYAEGGGGGGM
jgi:hypothetical protein